MKKIICLLVVISLLVSCKNKDHKYSDYYSIDLSVIFNDKLMSYKIDNNGKVIILDNSLNENAVAYEGFIGEEDLQNIQDELNKIVAVKCVPTEETYVDGTRYVMVLKSKDNSKRSTLISGTCKSYKHLDKIVFKIVNRFNSGNKSEIYESLTKIVPPPFPNSLKQ